MLPFTTEEFLGVFERYNESVWPMQVVLFLVGLAIVGLALSRQRVAGRAIAVLLGILWLWVGAAYHLGFFSRINPAAYGFAVLCIVQAILLLHVAAKNSWELRSHFDSSVAVGVILVGCHLNPRSRLSCHCLFADSQFCFALDDLNDCWQRGDVFFEAVASSKRRTIQLLYCRRRSGRCFVCQTQAAKVRQQVGGFGRCQWSWFASNVAVL